MKDCINAVILLTLLVSCANESEITLEEGNIPMVIGEMTTSEKTMMLVGTGCSLVGETAGTYAIPRLGIPQAIFVQTSAGRIQADSLRQGKQTSPVHSTGFPSGKALAATWNISTVHRVGTAIGEEALEMHADVVRTSAIDTTINPVLEGMIVSSLVQGIQANGAGACIEFHKPTQALEIALKDASPAAVACVCSPTSPLSPDSWKKISATLCKDWGFDGLLCESGPRKDAGAITEAGCPFFLPGSEAQTDNIARFIRDTIITEDVLDRRVESVLKMIVGTPRFKKSYFYGGSSTEENSDLSKEAAAESFVLLENKCLPVESDCRVAFFGNASYDLPEGCTSLSEGFSDIGFEIDDTPLKAHQERIGSFDKKYVELPRNVVSRLASKAAGNSALAIVTVGNRKSTDVFIKLEEDGKLNEGETTLIEEVCKAYHKAGGKVVVVLRTDSSLDISEWKDIPDAIITAWTPSPRWSCALADVICGNMAPEGRLPIEFKTVASQKGKKKQPVQPDCQYPLGFGLSYTQFTCTEPEVSASGRNTDITVQVTNEGERDGSFLLKLFSLDEKGKSELVGFTKTDAIGPGGSQSVTITVPSPGNETDYKLCEDGSSILMTVRKAASAS